MAPTDYLTGLVGFVKGLEEQGWTQMQGTFFDLSHVYRNEYRRIGIFPTLLNAYEVSPIFENKGPVNMADPVWVQAFLLMTRTVKRIPVGDAYKMEKRPDAAS